MGLFSLTHHTIVLSKHLSESWRDARRSVRELQIHTDRPRSTHHRTVQLALAKVLDANSTSCGKKHSKLVSQAFYMKLLLTFIESSSSHSKCGVGALASSNLKTLLSIEKTCPCIQSRSNRTANRSRTEDLAPWIYICSAPPVPDRNRT